tara:strand:+ start:4769 stop:5197 length:429 start_codon:yes stop_codon:yes gene_type:complete
MTNVQIVKLNDSAKLPTKGSEEAAAHDLYSTERVVIPPFETVAVGTGLRMEIPYGFKGEIYSRSGMAYQGVVVANSPGKIDSDYRGEIRVILHNNTDAIAYINHGDRIAQFEINMVEPLNFVEVKGLGHTARGEGGFGSTGK